ncbi:hypothetical protein M406DRAFT_62625 [Cryphonectria parasitica EP155]|uniref:DUF7924 domain-containing protein n=1 Tax=Cryphonectria parasitica (strain ATCC 38755 / EP155) TaxID=660469 RepID=A0A9P4Y7V9_CRYP1|nr:uncharacterized protein M406DRAFT_62625 [Cryphonectria parasitica EP155]KAF3768358.1 hypothetical protein M406DRAFT_62625 [Cryphonectria parasitica EP155]
MYFPFLTCEVMCGAAALDIADRQNAHSGTLAVRAVVELFRLGNRMREVNRQIMAFSISHDHRVMPAHFERICSAIDQLLSQLDLDMPPLSETRLSQEIVSHRLSQSDIGSARACSEQGHHQPVDDLETIPDTSFTGSASAKKAKRAQRRKR